MLYSGAYFPILGPPSSACYTSSDIAQKRRKDLEERRKAEEKLALKQTKRKNKRKERKIRRKERKARLRSFTTPLKFKILSKIRR